MDLNTALMESISSMSEYFVAANTRTSFNDVGDSGSSLVNQLNNTATNSSKHLHNNSNHSSSLANNYPTSAINQQAFEHHMSSALKSTSSNSIEQIHQNINNCGGVVDPLNTSPTNFSSSTNHNNNNNHHNHSNHYHNQSLSNTQSCSNTSHNCSTRTPQLIRTQIPIHCYIEQLDACANVSTFFPSTLSDDNLFSTTNSVHLNHVHNNKSSRDLSNNSFFSQSNDHHNNHHQHHPTPHLHQSKLALESVTNGSLASSLISNLPVSRSASVYTENASTDDNNDIDCLDSHLDHLNSDSPVSSNQFSSQTTTPTQSSLMNNSLQSTNICENTANNQTHNQFSSNDNQQFQSCRETYAIVTSNVLYIDLVRTVLLQLGYSAMDLINAKATLQIKNWRPLALDQVTDDKRATVGEVLGDISTFVTLRIRLYSPVSHLPTEWTETMIRQVVLALTQTMSQLTLSKLCNISQPLISSIVRGGKKLGRRKCAEFGQWYMNYIKSADARPSTMFCEGTSARLVFDKSREIPQLKAWFAMNTKPSDELLEEYSKILNEHTLRKDRPQVTGKALKNWWKNERQKLGIRQREFRGRPKLKQID